MDAGKWLIRRALRPGSGDSKIVYLSVGRLSGSLSVLQFLVFCVVRIQCGARCEHDRKSNGGVVCHPHGQGD